MGKLPFTSFLENLFDVAFPRSVSTRKLETYTPSTLRKHIPQPKQHILSYVDSLFEYRHPLTKQIVWHIKYRNNTTLGKTMALCMHDTLLSIQFDATLFANSTPPILVPIPMSTQRKRQRGFNQAYTLARLLYKHDPQTYKDVANVIQYKKSHKPQTSVSHREERIANVRNSMFVPHAKKIQGENIILIDDVTTTGATLKEARRALKDAGAKSVRAITIAH